MRIPVTGGAGHVGPTPVPMLPEQGHEVHGLDSLEFGGQGLLPCCQDRSFEPMKGDVTDPDGTKKALDATRMQEVLDRTPPTRLRDGLARTVSRDRANKAQADVQW